MKTGLSSLTIMLVLLIVFLIVAAVVLLIIFLPKKKHNNATGGVVNYDAFMRKFVFSVNTTRDDFYAALSVPNSYDPLSYTLSQDYSAITFSTMQTSATYRLYVEQYQGYIVLKLEQISAVSGANIPYSINPFFINKFRAVPLDFSRYAF